MALRSRISSCDWWLASHRRAISGGGGQGPSTAFRGVFLCRGQTCRAVSRSVGPDRAHAPGGGPPSPGPTCRHRGAWDRRCHKETGANGDRSEGWTMHPPGPPLPVIAAEGVDRPSVRVGAEAVGPEGQDGRAVGRRRRCVGAVRSRRGARGGGAGCQADGAASSAATMAEKSAAFRLAPPTRAPSTSGRAKMAAALAGLTEPP